MMRAVFGSECGSLAGIGMSPYRCLAACLPGSQPPCTNVTISTVSVPLSMVCARLSRGTMAPFTSTATRPALRPLRVMSSSTLRRRGDVLRLPVDDHVSLLGRWRDSHIGDIALPAVAGDLRSGAPRPPI